jgi:hypothetical protein
VSSSRRQGVQQPGKHQDDLSAQPGKHENFPVFGVFEVDLPLLPGRPLLLPLSPIGGEGRGEGASKHVW